MITCHGRISPGIGLTIFIIRVVAMVVLVPVVLALLGDVHKMDVLHSRLQPANCTLNNVNQPYQTGCHNGNCIAFPLNFTVQQHDKVWIKRFDITFPTEEALKMMTNMDKYFKRASLWNCFTDGNQLELYISDEEGKRLPAEILKWPTIIICATFLVDIYAMRYDIKYCAVKCCSEVRQLTENVFKSNTEQKTEDVEIVG